MIGLMYFNPLPRKEGDLSGRRPVHLERTISIHSLVKRETDGIYVPGQLEIISIHSLVKRETGVVKKVYPTEGISIHSLVKRETMQVLDLQQYCVFQSTPS